MLGRGPLDPADDSDLVVDLKEGDAIVLPAGVAHCSLESSPDYEYVGLYPKVCFWILSYPSTAADWIQGSPHWDNNFYRATMGETAQKAANARAVPLPDSDPMSGIGGPLVSIWEQAASSPNQGLGTTTHLSREEVYLKLQ